MTQQVKSTKCYISSFIHTSMDKSLQSAGISNGIISFAIPDYGVLFRCLGEGDLIDMEFSSFFALLEFIRSKFEKNQIKSVEVISSNPHFVFSFTTFSDRLKNGSAYRQLLNQFVKEMTISVGYIKPLNNKALISPADYPSMPADKKIVLSFTNEELHKSEFKALQKGIKL